MKIQLAESAGFCSGVKRAVRLALESVEAEHAPVYMLGDIVHNEYVVLELRQAGMTVVESLDQIDFGVLLIRAHGAAPALYAAARRKGLKIIDATCPLVLEIHKFARQLDEEGYQVVVIGDRGHDEVGGIAAQVKEPVVISSPEDVEKHFRRPYSRIGVVLQSTQDIRNVENILGLLAARCRELKLFNTICGPTSRHQEEIRTLPRENDVMIVIGSYTSANTCRLTAIAKELNPRSYQVESAGQIEAEWFKNVKSVGVSAGASTPDNIIQEVIERIRTCENS
ncbi:4-hydroxy-3-methylbut-2-enyl diphosphate reductase [candidate division KSB3 bacterium]|uniref:4-hydroxy-3-methylbut-2-enyl diphosphate reductase n=1 Tax=candidate division KSB3 bacterium TaxID=2044937 RepID=A0A2G6E176_9BACT|nr:MAG: 4-hydroxy-3-methylbut-2-enyl diphosphate reductase [candidate division KSB3 bacterium]PIE30335.1 MAG: 4-hydroxy-3-methylbut-2-enyl diphosphate reductase [candidate division KSB3 bacterium]